MDEFECQNSLFTKFKHNTNQCRTVLYYITGIESSPELPQSSMPFAAHHFHRLMNADEALQ
jgi:hypothetical protein